jgi:hypothetical protein
MSLSVTFSIQVRRGEYVSENELTANIDQYREQLHAVDSWIGEIVIVTDDGTEVHIEDDLDVLVQHLCFRCVRELRAGQHTLVQYWSYYGYVRLDPEANTVVISGDFIPKVRVMATDLLPALYSCGRRYLVFARNIYGHSEAVQQAYAAAEAEAEQARQALQG